MVRFTMVGDIGGLNIAVTIQHEDAARLRSGVTRFTRAITSEMVNFAFEEKRDADRKERLAAKDETARRLIRRRPGTETRPKADFVPDEEPDEDEDEEDDF